jgi:hypothetical protein
MPEETISQRIIRFLPADRPATFAELRQILEQDADALFELAIYGGGDDASIAVRGVEWLARTLSVLLRDGFSIETAAQQSYARGNRGGILALDSGRDDIVFLQDLFTGSAYGSKLESKKRSKSCVDFFLEDHSWDESVRQGRLLRVARDDAAAILGGLPRYQYEALLDCAREVVRCPAAVYPGLRHEGAMKSKGMAFCGIPSRRRTNDGSIQEPPEGFTFVVFVNPSDYVFDWDWVAASNYNPAIPRDADDRFLGEPLDGIRAELLLGNVRGMELAPFEPQRLWFSREGDCVFWYQSDIEAYAGRYDEYLTSFFALDLPNRQKCVGFKIKMVSYLIRTAGDWARTPHEGIVIEFHPDSVTVDLRFLMKAWVEANLPRSRELFPGMRLIESLGKEAVDALEKSNAQLEIPRHDLQPA